MNKWFNDSFLGKSLKIFCSSYFVGVFFKPEITLKNKAIEEGSDFI